MSSVFDDCVRDGLCEFADEEEKEEKGEGIGWDCRAFRDDKLLSKNPPAPPFAKGG
jgi:hypothetical protein